MTENSLVFLISPSEYRDFLTEMPIVGGVELDLEEGPHLGLFKGVERQGGSGGAEDGQREEQEDVEPQGLSVFRSLGLPVFHRSAVRRAPSP